MNTITDYVNNIVTPDTPFTHANKELEKLRDLLLTAQESVTFWGDRRIQVNGYQGFVSIDLISSKIYEVVRSRDFDRQINLLSEDEKKLFRDSSDGKRNYVHFTPEERIAGLEAIEKLKRLYRDADGKMNTLTKIISKIREFIFNWHFLPGSKIPKYNNKNLRWRIDSNDLDEKCRTFSPEEMRSTFPDNKKYPTENVSFTKKFIQDLIKKT